MTSAGAARDFRPDIQALRAVAVMLVLAFHLWPDKVTGGYIGVDVFFVISGYLITAHLATEVAATGTVSLRSFWARRIRRLVPAASLVLLASLIVTLVILPRAVWQQTMIEIAASAAYVQNWVLGASAVDYLGAENAPSIVQHYWSLSVEEQFYLVWPLLILLALLVNGRRARRSLFVALTLVFVLSLTFSIIETSVSAPLAYFHTGTRAWEFAAGGLLALAAGRTRWIERPVVATLGSWVGLALIFGSAFVLTSSSAFPGWVALAPVLGAVLVIATGNAKNRWAPAFLADFGPLQLAGGLSYGIYLWHWPLLVVVTHVMNDRVSLPAKLGIVVAAVGLAWLSKKFVEDPVRLRRFWTASRKPAFYLAATTVTVLVLTSGVTWGIAQARADASARQALEQIQSDPCFGAGSMIHSGCPSPFSVPADLDLAFAHNDRGVTGIAGCAAGRVDVVECDFGATSFPSHTIAIVGNSHAAHFVSGLETFGTPQGWKLVLMRKSDCVGVTTEPVRPRPDHDLRECLGWTENVVDELIARTDIDAVIFASYKNADDSVVGTDATDAEEVRAEQLMQATFRRLLDAGKVVIMLGDVPGTRPVDTVECVAAHLDEYDPCALPNAHRQTIMDVAARATDGVTRIDLDKYFCDEQLCHSVIGGVVVYFDSHHMTATYSRTVGQFIGPEIAALLAR